MAFVITNESDGDRSFSVTSGDGARDAPSIGAMPDGMSGGGSSPRRVVIQPGETAMLVHIFSEPGAATLSWTPVDQDEQGFMATVDVRE